MDSTQQCPWEIPITGHCTCKLMWHRDISGLVALFNGRQNKSRRNGRQHGLRRGGRWRYRCLISIISSPKLSIVDKRQVSDLLLCELLRYIGKRVRKTSNSSFFLTDGPVFVMYFEPRVGGFPLVHLHTCYLKYLSK